MEYISTEEAAQRLGVTIRRVQKLVRDKRLPAERVGRIYLIRESDLKHVENRKPGRPRKHPQSEVQPRAEAA